VALRCLAIASLFCCSVQERLDDYYRRNFEDYFNAMPPNEGQGSENQQRIQAWLQEQQTPSKLMSGETFPAAK
jgi:hypothetical protein